MCVILKTQLHKNKGSEYFILLILPTNPIVYFQDKHIKSTFTNCMLNLNAKFWGIALNLINSISIHEDIKGRQ